MIRSLALLGLLGAAACVGPPDHILSSSPGDGSTWADPIEPMQGFSWVEEDRLAALPRPGGRRPLAQDLDFLEQEGIDLLISFTIEPLEQDEVAARGIENIHIPVKDFTAPTLLQIQQFIDAVELAHEEGRLVAAHCTAGRGRTGTFMATWFVWKGMTAEDAIDTIRTLRPGSIETAAQEQRVHDWERFLGLGGPTRRSSR